MADGILYEDAVVVTNLIKNDDGTAVKLDLPFKTYSQIIWCDGRDVTYNLNDLKLENKEVLANIHYAKVDTYEGRIKGETTEVKAFNGTLTNPLQSAYYTKHCPITKETAFSTTDSNGDLVLYSGADKNDTYPFCISNAMPI